MKNKSVIKFSILLFLLIFSLYSSIPIYEKEDGTFKILIFKSNKYWHDGISPLITLYFKNYLQNKTFGVSNETVVDENYKFKVIDYVDVFCVNEKCYPNFYNFGLHIFFELSYILNKIIKFNPLRFLIFTNILVYSLSTVLIFLTLNKINKKKILLNLLITLSISLGTSFVIYSKYLFLHNSFQVLSFTLFLFFITKFEKEKNIRNFAYLTFSFFAFSLFYQALPAIILLLFFSFFVLTFYKRYLKPKILLLLTLSILLLIILNLNIFFNYLKFLSISKKSLTSGNIIYTIFPQTFYAVDIKPTSLVYTIRNNLGNAIFIKTYSLFGYFFGPKGIFVNSPFLLFSLLGMINFKFKNLKNKLLIFLVFYVFFVAYLNPDFEGGFTPRYVRHSEPIIAILSIFLPIYLMTELKKKSSKIIIFFGIIVILSILNSISLSVRTDWNYEKITDLVSYDTVFWPWLDFESKNLILDLTKTSEQAKWNLTWEDGCNPPITEPRFSENGLEMGLCNCIFKNYASRNLKIPKNIRYLGIKVCGGFTGGDGIIFEVSVDKIKNYTYYIRSGECREVYVDVKNFGDGKEHIIFLSAERNYVCDYEILIVKKIRLLNDIEISLNENIIKNDWMWKMYMPCKFYWFDDSIVSDVCYCRYPSFANASLVVPSGKSYLNIEACSDKGDGVLGKIIINNKVYTFFIPSKRCIKKSIFIENLKVLNLSLSSDKFGFCDNERVFWKSITFGNNATGDILKEGG